MNSLLKRNVSTLFLLSPIGINFEELDYKGFVDAYIKDLEKEDMYDKYYILLLFKLEEDQSDIFKELSENKYFVEDYDYDGYVVLVYVFPEEFQEDYDHIVKGEYSKVSDEFRKMFPKRVLHIPKKGKSFFQNSFPHKLINRFDYLLGDLSRFFGTEITPNMEFWKAFDFEKETLNISKIKENEKHNEGVPG